MEIVDTRVLQGRDVHLVEFQGKGGEQVRVTLAAGYSKRTDEQLVDAAKVMLVQVATFGVELGSPQDNPDPGVQDLNHPAVDADSYTLEYQEGALSGRCPISSYRTWGRYKKKFADRRRIYGGMPWPTTDRRPDGRCEHVMLKER